MIYLHSNNVIPYFTNCPNCQRPLPYHYNRTNVRCNNYRCKKYSNEIKGTFFAGATLPPNKILQMKNHHSFTTICDYRWYFSQLMSFDVEDSQYLVGGPNVIVEVDESKFDSRKYYKGHLVEGAWIVGGVERTDDRKFFAQKVITRDTDIIYEILKNNIAPGSIIPSDLGGAYLGAIKRLNNEGYHLSHKTVIRLNMLLMMEYILTLLRELGMESKQIFKYYVISDLITN